MRIALIGSGYVGLVSAACFAELGHEVTSVDNDATKIDALERGEVPIYEHFLPELLKRHHRKRLNFSTSITEAVRASEVVFISIGRAVGVPRAMSSTDHSREATHLRPITSSASLQPAVTAL